MDHLWILTGGCINWNINKNKNKRNSGGLDPLSRDLPYSGIKMHGNNLEPLFKRGYFGQVAFCIALFNPRGEITFISIGSVYLVYWS